MHVINIFGGVDALLMSNAQNCVVTLADRHPVRVDLIAELHGKSSVVKQMAEYGLANNITIFALIEAKLYQKTYLSTIVLDNGKVIGISDMTQRISPELYYDLGQSYRLYATQFGKIGVLIGDDLYYPECARTLTLSGAKALLAITKNDSSAELMLAVRANSLANGIKTIYHFADCAGLIGVYGEEAEQSGGYDTEIETDERLLLARRASVYNDVYLNDTV